MTNKEINAAYIGSQEVDKIYLGDALVYGGGEPEPIYSAMPLTFEVISAGTINFRKSSNSAPTVVVRYTMDDGETWATFTTATGTTNAIQVQPGDKVQFYGLNSSYAGLSTYNTFFGTDTDASTATVKVYGNIMSLVGDTDFTTATTLDGRFISMFANAGDKLVDASHLVLPATTLMNAADKCYQGMFQNCTSLATAPELPATTLTDRCYQAMFYGCTNLTAAPSLPATTLAYYCYAGMFQNCTSLTTAPELPATTMAENCYTYMFADCTSLTTAPALPGTALASRCYAHMFDGCTSLTTSPELPATTLTERCYINMFTNCSNLNYIKCLATDISASSCTTNWVSGVSSTGTFTKDASMTSWTTGESGIPDGWTVQDAT